MAVDQVTAAVDRLRVLAERLDAEWRKLPSDHPKTESGKLLWLYGVEAGRALLPLVADGVIGGDKDFDTLLAQCHPNEDARANGCFLNVWHRWLPQRRTDYKINHGENAKRGMGYAYADAMRAIADELVPSTPLGDDKDEWSHADYPSQLISELGLEMSKATFWRRRGDGTIRTRDAGGKLIQMYLPDVQKYMRQ